MAAAACALVLVTVARGPVALLAATTLAVLVGAVLGLPPLLRHDGIDWTWRSGRTDDVPPEPGIATLRRLLDPARRDATAAAELQELVRAIADDRTRAVAPSPQVGFPPTSPALPAPWTSTRSTASSPSSRR